MRRQRRRDGSGGSWGGGGGGSCGAGAGAQQPFYCKGFTFQDNADTDDMNNMDRCLNTEDADDVNNMDKCARLNLSAGLSCAFLTGGLMLRRAYIK